MSTIHYGCGHTREDYVNLEDTHFDWICFECAANNLRNVADSEPTSIPYVDKEGNEGHAPRTVTRQDVLQIINTSLHDIQEDGARLVNAVKESGVPMSDYNEDLVEELRQQATVLRIFELGVRAQMSDPDPNTSTPIWNMAADIAIDDQGIPGGGIVSPTWLDMLRRGIQRRMDENETGKKREQCPKCRLTYLCICDEGDDHARA
jgi:hypothetical protein